MAPKRYGIFRARLYVPVLFEEFDRELPALFQIMENVRVAIDVNSIRSPQKTVQFFNIRSAFPKVFRIQLKRNRVFVRHANERRDVGFSSEIRIAARVADALDFFMMTLDGILVGPIDAIRISSVNVFMSGKIYEFRLEPLYGIANIAIFIQDIRLDSEDYRHVVMNVPPIFREVSEGVFRYLKFARQPRHGRVAMVGYRNLGHADFSSESHDLVHRVHAIGITHRMYVIVSIIEIDDFMGNVHGS